MSSVLHLDFFSFYWNRRNLLLHSKPWKRSLTGKVSYVFQKCYIGKNLMSRIPYLILADGLLLFFFCFFKHLNWSNLFLCLNWSDKLTLSEPSRSLSFAFHGGFCFLSSKSYWLRLETPLSLINLVLLQNCSLVFSSQLCYVHI